MDFSILKKKKQDGAEPQPEPKAKPRPVQAPQRGGRGGGAFVCLLLGLILGGGGAGYYCSTDPNLLRGLIGMERLVSQSEMEQAVSSAKKQAGGPQARQPGPQAGRQEPRAAGPRQQERPGQPRQPGQRKPKNEEYLDEVGTRTGDGRDLARSGDVRRRSLVPGAQGEGAVLDFSRIRLTPESMERLTSLKDDGIQFFLTLTCKECRNGYALASNMHNRYGSSLPIGLSLLIEENDQVLIYAAWLAIRLIDEEEGWNFLNYAWNHKAMPNSVEVLQAYERFNPGFSFNALTEFWQDHMDELSRLIEVPFALRAERGWDGYSVPQISVNGRPVEGPDIRVDMDTLHSLWARNQGEVARSKREIQEGFAPGGQAPGRGLPPGGFQRRPAN